MISSVCVVAENNPLLGRSVRVNSTDKSGTIHLIYITEHGPHFLIEVSRLLFVLHQGEFTLDVWP